MVWWIITFLAAWALTLWIMLLGTAKEDHEMTEEELEEWFKKNTDGYREIYDEIKSEELPKGFEDLK